MSNFLPRDFQRFPTILARAKDSLEREDSELTSRCILTDATEMLLDESPVSSTAAALVCFPRTIAQVQTIARVATRLTVPMVPRGARTGLVGGCVPTEPSIVIDTSQMTRIGAIDLKSRYLEVDPGVTLGEIEHTLRPHGMMYPPDPASYARATIGGTVATNAGGLRCVKYGVTDRWIKTLDVVLADGTLVRFGHEVVKDVTGYDLKRLFIGSEGTLGIVARVGIEFCPKPSNTALILVAAPEIASALSVRDRVLAHSVPEMCELLDAGALRSRDCTVLDTPFGPVVHWGDDPTLLIIQIEQDDSTGAADQAIARVIDAVSDSNARSYLVPSELETVVLELRRGGSAVRSEQKPSHNVETPDEEHASAEPRLQRGPDATEESLVSPLGAAPSLPQDISVPIAQTLSMITTIRTIADSYGLESRIAAHIGDGNLHLLLIAEDFFAEDLDSERETADSKLELYDAMSAIVTAAIQLGGTVSGEHGIGSLKRGWANQDLGDDVIELLRRVKLAFDPADLMNPGKAF